MVELLKLGQQRVSSQRALAAALDLSESYVSRLLKGSEDSMGVGPCLRLARLVSMNPSEVLAIAGKQEDAKLIEEFYGAPIQLPDAERRLLRKAKELGGAELVIGLLLNIQSTLGVGGQAEHSGHARVRGARRGSGSKAS